MQIQNQSNLNPRVNKNLSYTHTFAHVHTQTEGILSLHI